MNNLINNPIVKMNLKIALILSFLIPVYASCKADSEELSHFKGGAATRGELRAFLKLSRRGSQSKSAGIRIQDQALRLISIVRIAAIEAGAIGLKKEKEFIKESSLRSRQLKLAAFNAYLMHGSDFEKSFAMQELQHLKMSGNPAKAAKNPRKVPASASTPSDAMRIQAEELLKKLNDPKLSDEDIRKLIAEKTALNSYRPTGGYEIPVCTNCIFNQHAYMTNHLKNPAKKGFVLVTGPGGSLWIVRSVGRKNVDADNLESYYADYFKKQARFVQKFIKNMQNPRAEAAYANRYPLQDKKIKSWAKQYGNRIVRMEKSNQLNSLIKQMQKKKKLVLHPAGKPIMRGKKIPEIKDEDIIFSLSGKPFTYANLKKFVGLEKIDPKFRHSVVNITIRLKLLGNRQDFKDALESDIGKFIMSFGGDRYLANYYFRKQMPSIKVTATEIRTLYNLRKHTEFKGKSYAFARKSIEGRLKRNKQNRAAKQMRDTLAKKYNLEILREKLKAGKI